MNLNLNKKKHFIFGGYPGVIYFSWLAVVFFLTFIFAYESTNGINPMTFVFGGLFIIWLLYTFLFSYIKKIDSENYEIKLPFRKKFLITNNQLTWSETNKFVRTVKVQAEHQIIYTLYFSKGRK